MGGRKEIEKYGMGDGKTPGDQSRGRGRSVRGMCVYYRAEAAAALVPHLDLIRSVQRNG